MTGSSGAVVKICTLIVSDRNRFESTCNYLNTVKSVPHPQSTFVVLTLAVPLGKGGDGEPTQVSSKGVCTDYMSY